MKRYAVYRTTAAPLSRKVGSAGLALAVTSFLAKRFGFISADVFVLSLIAAAVIALAALALAMIAVNRIWSRGGPGVPAALTGGFFGLVALLAPGLVIGLLFIDAGTSDLSTDRQDPPDLKFQALTVEEPFLGWLNNSLEERVWPLLVQLPGNLAPKSEEAEKAYPDIVPRRYRIAPAQLHAAGEKALADLNWKVVDELPPDLLDAPTHLQAESTTRILGLKHDVTLRIRPDAVGARLDIRARSRTPLKDLSDNADRIRTVFGEIDRVLLETYGDLARLSVEEGSEEDEEIVVEPLEGPRDTIPLPGFKPYFEDEDEAPAEDGFGVTDLEG